MQDHSAQLIQIALLKYSQKIPQNITNSRKIPMQIKGAASAIQYVDI